MSNSNEDHQKEKPSPEPKSISLEEVRQLEDAAEAGDLEAQKRLAETEGLESYEEYKRLNQEISVKFETNDDSRFASIFKSIADAGASKPYMDQMREMLADASHPLNKASADLIEEIQKTFKPETVAKLQEIIGLESSKEKWISELSKIDWSQSLTQGTLDMPIKALDNESVPASLLVPYYPSVEVQLMDEMAKNNRLNRELLEELKKQNRRSESAKPLGFEPRFPGKEYLIQLQTSLEYWPAPFDTLDSTLWHVIEVAQLSMFELSYRRDLAASAKVIYYIDWKLSHTQSICLGRIDLRKLDTNLTEVRIESLVTGQRVKPFVEVVRNLRGYSEDAKKISKVVLDESKSADSQAAIAKRASAGKLRRKKNKMPAIPTGKNAAYRWVLVWEKIEPKINEDPTLRIDHDELIQYLKANGLSIKDDTLRKIITRGRAGKIPSRTEFERKNKM